MTFFVILVIIVIAIAVSNSASKKKREEEERQQIQKAKADVAAASQSIFRLLEALDILEDKIKGYSGNLNFYRNIGPSIKTHDSVFEMTYGIINSKRNPLVKEALVAIVDERGMRNDAKKSGESSSTASSFYKDTVWRDYSDEQIKLLYDMMIDLDEGRSEYNDIELKGELPLRFDNPSGYDSYKRKANVYVRALAEAIHAKFPEYGFEANTYGISFHGKNGLVSYDGI